MKFDLSCDGWKWLQARLKFYAGKCATRVDGGIDRISELPDEIILVILSFLPLKDAVRASVLSSRWLDLWKRTANMKFDRLSQLPDRAIILILSFLHLRAAAATSVLSTRFSNLWKKRPNLNFDGGIVNLDLNSRTAMARIPSMKQWYEAKCKFVQVVDSVLQSHKGVSLKEFSVSFWVNRSAQLRVVEWLKFVFLKRGGVERLKLYLRCEQHTIRVVLGDLLREGGLRSPEALVSFRPLKTLCLGSLHLRGEDIELFLRNCPFLEELMIHDSNLISDVEVCGSADLKLRRLAFCGFGSHLRSMKVSAPNLTWLMVDDISGKLLLENVPKLVEGNFRFQGIDIDEMLHLASAVFCFGSQLKVLKLDVPKLFFANVFPQLPNLEKLVVEYHGQSLLPVTALVWAAPRLQEFRLLYYKRSNAESNEVVEKVARSPHLHLKVFELGGFLRVADHIEFATYVLDNCVALQKIVINCRPISMSVGVVSHAEIVNEMKFAKQYAKQELQGKIPQHIQLKIL